jgi:hypothetical protein
MDMNRRAFLGVVGAACLSPRFAIADGATGEMSAPTEAELARYTWLDASSSIRRLDGSIAPPSGYARVAASSDSSFAAWLRGLPLRASGTPVKSYAGKVLHEASDSRIAAVAEIDCGTADLQQCADSAIRMHAEWLWSRGDKARIGYHFLSGDLATYSRYAAGERPSVDGNKVVWKPSAKPADSRATFRSYLDMVFMYASTISLAKESSAVDRSDLAPGDFFIHAGSPGHAVVILDLAASSSGDRVALLGQGYMPAQDFQVLASDTAGSPWFAMDGDEVATPFWDPFPWSALHRFPSRPK